MLRKTLVAAYGKTPGTGEPRKSDLVHSFGPVEETAAFRTEALEDISGAQVFVLDQDAASYADSFREGIQGRGTKEDEPLKVAQYMREIALPSDLVWVEYDHKALFIDRVKRGHEVEPGWNTPDEYGQRGFLFDNRNPDKLKIQVFRTTGDGGIIDPASHGVFLKGPDGTPNFENYHQVPHAHMLMFLERAGGSLESTRDVLAQDARDIGYDMALAYMVFALIASSEGDVMTEEKATLSPKEEKTARKFGKIWMVDALRSHITIRIGPEARAHLKEQAERLQYERDVATSRSRPIEHWVAEHERHYKNGKIVKIKAHRRGSGGEDIPRRVIAPGARSAQ